MIFFLLMIWDNIGLFTAQRLLPRVYWRSWISGHSERESYSDMEKLAPRTVASMERWRLLISCTIRCRIFVIWSGKKD